MVYMYAKESRFERKVFVFLMKFNVKAIQLHLTIKSLHVLKEEKKSIFLLFKLVLQSTGIQSISSLFSQNGFIISILKACFVETITYKLIIKDINRSFVVDFELLIGNQMQANVLKLDTSACPYLDPQFMKRPYIVFPIKNNL